MARYKRPSWMVAKYDNYSPEETVGSSYIDPKNFITFFTKTADGNPLSGVRIGAWPLDDFNNNDFTTAVCNACTGVDGVLNVGPVQPGTKLFVRARYYKDISKNCFECGQEFSMEHEAGINDEIPILIRLERIGE